MKVTLSLTKAEAEAVLRANFSVGMGVRRSRSLEAAEAKIHESVASALDEAPR